MVQPGLGVETWLLQWGGLLAWPGAGLGSLCAQGCILGQCLLDLLICGPEKHYPESLEMPFAGARFATDAPSPRGDGLTHLSFCNVVAVRTSRLIKVQDACHALQAPKTCLFLSSLSIFKEVEVSVLAGRVDLTRKCISPSRDPSGDCAETGNPVTHRKSLHACLTTSFEAAIPFSSHDSRSSGFEKQK
ncbi:hypothetical protein Y1Q_0010991 [Alligator mississippiensis]|uniref:Uncharacterized protein n=1 Tax=Alligator mississippiensis TaxID=8496 RepID=A0A151NLQ2_ALLMI|nr:hypothetical protein Y1Q_0010991 [Alligator mississippiensis]